MIFIWLKLKQMHAYHISDHLVSKGKLCLGVCSLGIQQLILESLEFSHCGLIAIQSYKHVGYWLTRSSSAPCFQTAQFIIFANFLLAEIFPLFPVCWIASDDTIQKVSKVRIHWLFVLK